MPERRNDATPYRLDATASLARDGRYVRYRAILALRPTWSVAAAGRETSKRRNVETSKRRNVETSKRRNVEAPYRLTQKRSTGPAPERLTLRCGPECASNRCATKPGAEIASRIIAWLDVTSLGTASKLNAGQVPPAHQCDQIFPVGGN
jgi:hypothetical protein